jgi:hypothetical protein
MLPQYTGCAGVILWFIRLEPRLAVLEKRICGGQGALYHVLGLLDVIRKAWGEKTRNGIRVVSWVVVTGVVE